MMAGESKLSLGEKIRQIRIAKGLSQENLATALQCSDVLVSRIERGLSECDAEKLVIIKKYMGIENAPLLDSELEIYNKSLWALYDDINNNRIAQARAMHDNIFPITSLPFEGALSMLYTMIEIRLLYREDNFTAGEEKLNKADIYLKHASTEALHIYHRNKGDLYIYGGKLSYKDALWHYLQLLDLDNCSLKPVPATYLNIGHCYYNLGKTYHAILYFERIKTEHNSDSSSHQKMIIDHMLGVSYMQIGEHGKAKKLLESAIAQAQSVHRHGTVGVILSNMASLNIKMDNPKEGLRLCNQALVSMQENRAPLIKNYDALHAMTLFFKARCLFMMNTRDKCIEAINQGIAFTKEKCNVAVLAFEALRHTMTLNNSESTAYLEDVAIPGLIASKSAYIYIALDICKALEAHYKKKGTTKKALAITAIIKDIYEEMFFVK